MIEIFFGGHLSFYAAGKKSQISYPLTAPTSLATILKKLRIPQGEIVLVVLNGEVTDQTTIEVKPGDRIDLYPPMSGG